MANHLAYTLLYMFIVAVDTMGENFGMFIGVAFFAGIIELVLLFAVLRMTENIKEITRILTEWERERRKNNRKY
jgi:hypothetical protein